MITPDKQKPTSYLISQEAKDLLALLAKKEGRSNSKQVEQLIKDAAQAAGIKLPKPPAKAK